MGHNASNCYDSVTEKIYDALIAGAVPVYLGAPNIEEFVPSGSYIDVRSFSGPRELSQFLIEVANDPKRYEKFHEWRKQTVDGPAFNAMRNVIGGAVWYCNVLKLAVNSCSKSEYNRTI